MKKKISLYICILEITMCSKHRERKLYCTTDLMLEKKTVKILLPWQLAQSWVLAGFESTTSSSQLASHPCCRRLSCWSPLSRRRTWSRARTCQEALGWGLACSWTVLSPAAISEKKNMRKLTSEGEGVWVERKT